MDSAEEERDWLPLKTGFDTVWRGWRPEQVQDYLERVETDVQLLLTDRDAAVSQVDDLLSQLTAARSQISHLQRELDRICLTPVDPEALDARLRRRVELAEFAAKEIVASAEAAAQRRWAQAQAAADRLQECYEELIEQAQRRRYEAENAYQGLIERTHAEVEEMTQRADADRRQLDVDAESRRQRIEREFEEALAHRKADDDRRHEQREAASKAEAQRILRGAAAEAERRIGRANNQVEEIRKLRDAIAQQLNSARELLGQAQVQPPAIQSALQRQSCARAGRPSSE